MVHIESEASLNWPSDGHMFSIPMLKRKAFSQKNSLLCFKKGSHTDWPISIFFETLGMPPKDCGSIKPSRCTLTCQELFRRCKEHGMKHVIWEILMWQTKKQNKTKQNKPPCFIDRYIYIKFMPSIWSYNLGYCIIGLKFIVLGCGSIISSW